MLGPKSTHPNNERDLRSDVYSDKTSPKGLTEYTDALNPFISSLGPPSECKERQLEDPLLQSQLIQNPFKRDYTSQKVPPQSEQK